MSINFNNLNIVNAYKGSTQLENMYINNEALLTPHIDITASSLKKNLTNETNSPSDKKDIV